VIKLTNIHVKIKSLRTENKYRQKEVAQYLGISQQAYSYYELNKHELPSRHALGLAKLYHVSMDYLYGEEPDQTGFYDLSATFFQDYTFKDVIISLQKLNPEDREEVIRFLSYLIGSHPDAGEQG
jgi:transcriptional regulator with XRE-family HTH domain